MKLMRWQRPASWALSPFRGTTTLRDEIDRLFDQAFDRFFESPLALSSGTQFLGAWGPAIDLYDEKENLVLKAEIPGMKKEDIEVSLQEGFLSISGERKESHESAETHRSERFVGRFHRTLSLPVKVQGDKIKATYKDGVLRVVLPKAEEAKPKQIPVTVK